MQPGVKVLFRIRQEHWVLKSECFVSSLGGGKRLKDQAGAFGRLFGVLGVLNEEQRSNRSFGCLSLVLQCLKEIIEQLLYKTGPTCFMQRSFHIFILGIQLNPAVSIFALQSLSRSN